MKTSAVILVAIIALAASSACAQTATPAPPPRPPCREVGDVASIRIDPAAAARLAEIGLDRPTIFAQMRETSLPETMGCWAMPAGNFDSQLISVGMAQWSYGTGSLQPLLERYRKNFRSRRDFKRTRDMLAPTYGKLLFSKGCRAIPVRAACRAAILAAQGPDRRNNTTLEAELTALFERDAMWQVQADFYVALLDQVRLDLQRVFPAGPYTRRKVRWATDTRVQQGGLPGDEDIARLRAKLAAQPAAAYWLHLLAILDWYDALARTIDQDGIVRDYEWNDRQWRCLVYAGRIDPEQYELLNLTFLKSRTAVGNSGRWQALTFERRAKVILDVGSVSGKADGACAPS